MAAAAESGCGNEGSAPRALGGCLPGSPAAGPCALTACAARRLSTGSVQTLAASCAYPRGYPHFPQIPVYAAGPAPAGARSLGPRIVPAGADPRDAPRSLSRTRAVQARQSPFPSVTPRMIGRDPSEPVFPDTRRRRHRLTTCPNPFAPYRLIFPSFNRKCGICGPLIPPFCTFSTAVDMPVHKEGLLPAQKASLFGRTGPVPAAPSDKKTLFPRPGSRFPCGKCSWGYVQ